MPGKVNAPGGYPGRLMVIRRLQLTHASGAGCAIHQDVPLLPTVEPVTVSPAMAGTFLIEPRYLPSFDHEHEQAGARFYGVTLDPGTEREIAVELSATTRTGVGRIVFRRRRARACCSTQAAARWRTATRRSWSILRGARSRAGRKRQFCYHRRTCCTSWHSSTVRSRRRGRGRGEALSTGTASVEGTFNGDFPCRSSCVRCRRRRTADGRSCGGRQVRTSPSTHRDQQEQLRCRRLVRERRRRARITCRGRGCRPTATARRIESWRDALGHRDPRRRGRRPADVLHDAVPRAARTDDVQRRRTDIFGMDGGDAGGGAHGYTIVLRLGRVPQLDPAVDAVPGACRRHGWSRWSRTRRERLAAAGRSRRQTDVMVGDPAGRDAAGAYVTRLARDRAGALAAMIRAPRRWAQRERDYRRAPGALGLLPSDTSRTTERKPKHRQAHDDLRRHVEGLGLRRDHARSMASAGLRAGGIRRRSRATTRRRAAVARSRGWTLLSH